MTTLAIMKARIAWEFRRDDLTTDIANAIPTAIDVYKYERFPFNRAAFVGAPATDGETNNPWMTTAERLIRCRAMLEVAVNVIKRSPDDPIGAFISDMQQEIADAQRQLRLSQTVSGSSALPGTRAAMKVRIANEINRGDLAPEIDAAIGDAIDYWSGERYFFNETRDTTFQTVAAQDSYGINEFNDILNVIKIDYVHCIVSGQIFKVYQRRPETIELSIQNSGLSIGIPAEYSFYNQALRLYPVPGDVYDIRVAYQRAMPQPATDTETGNVWMTGAERLIRSQAKAELYSHVSDIADANEAQKYAALAQNYADVIKSKTTKMTHSAGGRVLPYC